MLNLFRRFSNSTVHQPSTPAPVPPSAPAPLTPQGLRQQKLGAMAEKALENLQQAAELNTHVGQHLNTVLSRLFDHGNGQFSGTCSLGAALGNLAYMDNPDNTPGTLEEGDEDVRIFTETEAGILFRPLQLLLEAHNWKLLEIRVVREISAVGAEFNWNYVRLTVSPVS